MDDTPSQTETRFSDNFLQASPVALNMPALTLLMHPDIRRVGERVTLPALMSGQAVELSRRKPFFAFPGTSQTRGLEVSYISRKPLRLTAGEMKSQGTQGELLLERSGSNTPVRVNGEPLSESYRLTAADLERGTVFDLGGRVVLLLHWCAPTSHEIPRFGLVGDSDAMQRLRNEVVLAAGVDAPVLLRGASGTGKELVAHAIHKASERCDGPCITVNMAAIPSSLAASELFGSLKGAFTGAHRRQDGFFLAAHGGTLFLDEIGDASADIQPLLLRALESGEIQPVGSAQSRRVDVRVIAATDVDLEARIAEGLFRTPLLHRLAGFEIRLPLLAERRDDIGRLLVHFLARELGGIEPLLAAADTAAERPWPPAPLVARLAAYPWPGNVRQLANVARRLAITQKAGQSIDLGPFIESLLTDRATSPATPSVSSKSAPLAEPILGDGKPSDIDGMDGSSSPTGRWRPVYRKGSEIDEDELVDALRGADFELSRAAQILGISRSVLYKLVEACPRVRKASDLGREEIEQTLASQGNMFDAARALEVSLQGLRLRMKSLNLR